MHPSSEIIPMSNSDQWLPHFISKKSLNLFIDVLNIFNTHKSLREKSAWDIIIFLEESIIWEQEA